MNMLKLLVVEDDEQDLRVCRDSVARYKNEKQREIDLVECKTVDEAFQKLDNSFDGAIIDLKLADQGNEGDLVIKKIVESYFRIPIAIFTGTPDTTNRSFSYIGIFKKGETEFTYLFDNFWGIYNSGLTRIMGGRGVIEVTLSDVFQKNLLPQKDTWVIYGMNNPQQTEKALLRYTLNHLMQLLDDDTDLCFPEEVYIYPPLDDKIKTGSILTSKKGLPFFMVLNPACDLVIRNDGKFKTDRILLVEIELDKTIRDIALAGITKKEKKQNKLKALLSNNYSDYFHWLPKTNFFDGGFLNFRKLNSLSVNQFKKTYNSPKIQISSSFVKDIVSRFASYYARQGQPDIACDEIINHFIDQSQE